MCIAIFKPENIVLPEETLKTCWKNNPHGAGFMYAEDGKLYVQKGLMDYKEFMEAYTPHKKKRVVLHFRVASIGEISPENTHPYVVRKGKIAFVHNGTIHKIGGVRNTGESDTSKFNQKFLTSLPPSFMKSFGLLHMLEDYVGKSRLVFMNNLGEVVIVNADEGDAQVDGLVWYSNDSYKETVTKYVSNAVEWDEEKQTFVKKSVASSSSSTNSHTSRYSTIDDYDDDPYGYYSGCHANACSVPRIPARTPAPLKDKDLIQLSDLVYDMNTNRWNVPAIGSATEDPEVPKLESCTNCGKVLFLELEWFLGVCGDCNTDYTCPGEECDQDLYVADFLKGECLECGEKLDLKKLQAEGDTTFPPAQDMRMRGSEDGDAHITTITRAELESYADELQLTVVDLETGD